jgi:MFS family permease
MVVSAAILISTDLMLTYLPAFGLERGIPVEVVGLLLSLRALSSMAARIGMAWLIGRVGRRLVLTGSLVLAAVAIAAITLADEVPILVALVVLMGLGQGIGQPLTMSWVAAKSPPELRGTALALRITGNRLGLVLVPAAVGAVASAAGLLAVFVWASSMLGAAAVLAARTPLDD